MIELQLSDEEARMLREILENDLSDLRMEIADTDSMTYREPLKRTEECIRHWIEDLRIVN